MKVLDRAVVSLLPAVPRRVVQRLSSRYIAGPTLEDARHTVASLNAEGKYATVDVLGEEVTEAAEAESIANAYHQALEAIYGDQLESNISVKLTALGLEIDLDLCRALLGEVVEDTASRDTFVRIDMEDSSCTDDTLALYRELRESGRDNAPRWDEAMKRIEPGAIEYRRVDNTIVDASQRPTRYDYDRYFFIVNERARLGFAPPQAPFWPVCWRRKPWRHCE